MMSEVFPIPNEGSKLFGPISTILNARGPLLVPCIVQVRGCRTIRHYYHIKTTIWAERNIDLANLAH